MHFSQVHSFFLLSKISTSSSRAAILACTFAMCFLTHLIDVLPHELQFVEGVGWVVVSGGDIVVGGCPWDPGCRLLRWPASGPFSRRPAHRICHPINESRRTDSATTSMTTSSPDLLPLQRIQSHRICYTLVDQYLLTRSYTSTNNGWYWH